MRPRFSRLVVVLSAGLAVLAVCAQAQAASVSLCVPSAGGQPLTSGTCASSGTSGTDVALPASSADQQTLISILPYVNFNSSGIDGKPTIQFQGVNVQLINGAGSTASVNGEGNLVLGYDENPGSQTGSHDLVLGQRQSFTGYSELLDGYLDSASGRYAAAFGYYNKASGGYSLVAAEHNTASGSGTTVTGGAYNTAASSYSSIAGGCSNITAAGSLAINSICNQTSKYPHSFTTVTGGVGNKADGIAASVSGGIGNIASGDKSSISGGIFNRATDSWGSILGGCDNTTGTGPSGSTCGDPGANTISGGYDNKASGTQASISGGFANTSSGTETSILGGHSETLSGPDQESQAGATLFAP